MQFVDTILLIQKFIFFIFALHEVYIVLSVTVDRDVAFSVIYYRMMFTLG